MSMFDTFCKSNRLVSVLFTQLNYQYEYNKSNFYEEKNDRVVEHYV
jgi:hypothetical protein